LFCGFGRRTGDGDILNAFPCRPFLFAAIRVPVLFSIPVYPAMENDSIRENPAEKCWRFFPVFIYPMGQNPTEFPLYKPLDAV
jgi:hypothetical protein